MDVLNFGPNPLGSAQAAVSSGPSPGFPSDTRSVDAPEGGTWRGYVPSGHRVLESIWKRIRQAQRFWEVVPLEGASPGLQSGEAGFQARENVPVKSRALALVRTEIYTWIYASDA
jgi:hypothetical protein